MPYSIEQGDKVRIVYTNDDGELTDNKIIDAYVLHKAYDTGDMWHFQDMRTGKTFAQNPQSSFLDKIILLEKML